MTLADAVAPREVGRQEPGLAGDRRAREHVELLARPHAREQLGRHHVARDELGEAGRARGQRGERLAGVVDADDERARVVDGDAEPAAGRRGDPDLLGYCSPADRALILCFEWAFCRAPEPRTADRK